MKKNVWDWTALVLLVIGGFNWGLIGIFDFNLVAAIFNSWAPVITTIAYILVGISAIYGAFRFFSE